MVWISRNPVLVCVCVCVCVYLCAFLSLHRNIVKLTAMFVARNGAQFMDQLMMREQKNEMFDFLRKNHILFAYFIKLVEQYTKVCPLTRTGACRFGRRRKGGEGGDMVATIC